MKDESKAVFCLLEDLFVILNEEDTNHVEERCLKFLGRYKHVRDKFDKEFVWPLKQNKYETER